MPINPRDAEAGLIAGVIPPMSGPMIDHWSFAPTEGETVATDARPEFTITLVGDRQQLHCTGHDPQLLLGDWLAEEDWNPETAQGITDAANAHKPEHPGAWDNPVAV